MTHISYIAIGTTLRLNKLKKVADDKVSGDVIAHAVSIGFPYFSVTCASKFLSSAQAIEPKYGN